MIDLCDKNSVEELLERFSGFFDAVIVEVGLELPRNSRSRQATIRLLAENRDGGWNSVTIRVGELREFKFVEGRVSNLVLSDGIGIHWLDDGLFVDLAPFTEAPVAPDELRRSHQYVFGATGAVEVTAVPE